MITDERPFLFNLSDAACNNRESSTASTRADILLCLDLDTVPLLHLVPARLIADSDCSKVTMYCTVLYFSLPARSPYGLYLYPIALDALPLSPPDLLVACVLTIN